jgi:hypothetical protein
MPPTTSSSNGAGAVATAAAAAAAAAANPAAAAWRSELFLKPGAPPAAAVAGLLPWRRISVVNKDGKDDLLGALGALRTAAPGCDVCLHYSLVRGCLRKSCN